LDRERSASRTSTATRATSALRLEPGRVQVDVERDGAAEGVEVEAADVGVEFVFHEHAFGVAGE
jgi:hypothetical protein